MQLKFIFLIKMEFYFLIRYISFDLNWFFGIKQF